MNILGKKRNVVLAGEVTYCKKYDKVCFFLMKQAKGGSIPSVTFDPAIINNIQTGSIMKVLDFSLQNQQITQKNGLICYQVRAVVNCIELLDPTSEQAFESLNNKTNVANYLDQLLEQEDKKNEAEVKKELEATINWE